MKRGWWIALALLTVPVALADLGSLIQNVFSSIVRIGQLNFLGVSSQTIVVGFVRILIWIMLFTIFFAVIPSIGADKAKNKPGSLSFLSRKHAGIVAFCVATISAVFMPAEALLAMGAGWSTLIALILIGGPIGGLAYWMWTIPGKEIGANGQPTGKNLPETKGTIALKFGICLLMLWILTAMGHHLALLGGAGY